MNNRVKGNSVVIVLRFCTALTNLEYIMNKEPISGLQTFYREIH